MKIVLAYSGGLDTSVIVKWLRETYDADIITLAADIGQEEELKGLPGKARRTGASKHYTLDLVDEIFRASAVILDRTPAYPSGPAAIRQLERETVLRSDQPDLAEMEFRYRTRAYGALLPPTRNHLDDA